MKTKIWILESPSPDDAVSGPLSGETLSRVLNFSQEDVEYRLCLNRETFARSVQSFCDHGRVASSFPILHIDAHGHHGGVGLTSGEFLSWDELHNMLRPLLQHRGSAMLLCMGSCQGIHAREIAMNLDDEQSVGAIIGSAEDVYTFDCAIAYMAFYRRFRRGSNPEQCIAAMNAVYGSDAFRLVEGRRMREGVVAYLRAHAPQLLERILAGEA